jgi:hypothetical protein
MNFRVCKFIVLRTVVDTSVTWSIVAIGRCCVPALAGVVWESGIVAGVRMTDAPSTGDVLWGG